ncbi:MAG: CPBP family intramembrane metalloprotease [Simkaniaceae bacterium]|nr:CPBP family intramembrane metalloprotease [Candidatus Sacchlamyda saccharinae]
MSSALLEKDLSLGVRGAVISLSGGLASLKGSEFLLKQWGVRVSNPQTYFRYYELLNGMGNVLLRGALKTLAIFYAVLFVPIAEEWLFRDAIYKWQEKDEGASRVYRILANGAVFGAFHVNFFYGLSNIPVVAVATFAGIVFAALREKTGNIYASIIAHSINNAVVLFLNF